MFNWFKKLFKKKNIIDLFADGNYKKDKNWETINLNLNRLQAAYKLPMNPYELNYQIPEFGLALVKSFQSFLNYDLNTDKRMKKYTLDFYSEKCYYILSDEKRFEKWLEKALNNIIRNILILTHFTNKDKDKLILDLKPIIIATLSCSKINYLFNEGKTYIRLDNKKYYDEYEKFRYGLRILYLFMLIVMGSVSKDILDNFKVLWNEVNKTETTFDKIEPYILSVLVNDNFNKSPLKKHGNSFIENKIANKGKVKTTEELSELFKDDVSKIIQVVRIQNRLSSNEKVSEEDLKFYRKYNFL